MHTFAGATPLTDAEIETLDEALGQIDPDEAMTVEELDGFCAALACCPDPVSRDEWLPLVLGANSRAAQAARGEGGDAALLRLIDRHQLSVSAMLHDGEGLAPVLARDEAGHTSGSAWAIGFARGMALRPQAWDALDDDDEHADALEPVMRLVADTDPQAVAVEGDDEPYEPIADDERESVIHDMLDGVQDTFDFFREARRRALSPAPARRAAPKVGRNDPCPCGSGKKYKQCHGRLG